MSNTYSYQEVYNASLKYFNGNELSAKVFVDKYSVRDGDKYYELTPDDMHKRLAKEFARIEKNKFKQPFSEDFLYNLFKNFERIVPQGSPMFGIGNPYQIVSLSNCFVVDSPSDSYGGICKTDQEIAQISKRRGGIGYDISTLRPKNSYVKNAAHTTTGGISFMHRFSNTGREVGQGGRRAAQMISCSVHYPDIEDFIKIKADDVSVTGANISVRLTNDFLNAVEYNNDYELKWPVDSKNPKVNKKISAKKIWNSIIHHAWLRAEPGILFWDNIINESPADCYSDVGYKTVSTNPCGEIPISAGDSCRLLIQVLFYYVKNPFTTNAYFDFLSFYEDAIIAQRLMDDLIDLELECIDKILSKIENDPEKEDVKQIEKNLWKQIRTACENGRRTGLGVTAVGDTLAALGIRYGSDESIKLVGKIYQILKFGSYRSSVEMAKELGPFPVWDWGKEKDNPFINRIKDEDIYLEQDNVFANFQLSYENQIWVSGKDLFNDIKKYGRRNIANLTTAPVGTTSLMVKIGNRFGSSSGIEPCYTVSYTRRKKGNPGDKDFRTDFIDQSGDHWMEFEVRHAGLDLWREITGETDNKKSPYFGACAADINWVQRVKLQAEAQKHIDHSISSTINLPNDVTEEKVAEIYLTAWKSGCKGITVYRDGCRTGVLVEKPIEKIIENASRRKKELDCDIFHGKIYKEDHFILIGLMDGEPYEVFLGKGKFNIDKGKIVKMGKGHYSLINNKKEIVCENICGKIGHDEEATTRLISTSLRHKIPLEFILAQLIKTEGPLHSTYKVIARCLKKYIKDGSNGESCPNCNEKMIFVEGCQKCVNPECGYSKCG